MPTPAARPPAACWTWHELFPLCCICSDSRFSPSLYSPRCPAARGTSASWGTVGPATCWPPRCYSQYNRWRELRSASPQTDLLAQRHSQFIRHKKKINVCVQNLHVADLSIHIEGGSENFGITLYFWKMRTWYDHWVLLRMSPRKHQAILTWNFRIKAPLSGLYVWYFPYHFKISIWHQHSVCTHQFHFTNSGHSLCGISE